MHYHAHFRIILNQFQRTFPLIDVDDGMTLNPASLPAVHAAALTKGDDITCPYPEDCHSEHTVRQSVD